MGETDVATMANVTIALYDFDDDAFSSISEDARDFIRKLLVKDKDARLTATQCLQHPWLRRKQPLPKPKVEQLESTKDNLRSFVDRWGDGTSPVPFIVQSPNNVKEIETGEPKLPSGMTPPDHIKPSVVIPKDVQIKIDALSPTSPHSPLPKKIKLQDEAGSESAKTKTGKKSDSKPKNGSIKKSKTLATDKESTQKNNEKGKESVNDISKCDSYSTQRKNSDHNCLVTPEPKLIAKSSPKLERNVDAESVDNQLEKSHDIENKLPTPQSLGPAKTDCDKNLSKNNLITIFNNSRNIKPGGGNECGKNEEISNSASSNSISTQQLGVRDALLTNGNDAAQGSSNLTSVLSKDTSKPSTNGVGYQKDLSNQTPDSPSMNAKVEATLPPPNTNIALKNETTLHQSNETEPHQKQTPASVILPTIQNKTNQQSEAKILTDASSTSAISSLPRINIIPIKVEKSDSSPLGGKTTIGRGSEVEGNNAHLEDKPKKVSNISGLKSIWGSKISANESKSTGHPIVKYNRTLSSPTPNTAKSRTTISQRQNKLEENEVTTSQTASTLNPVKVVLHRIEVDNNHSGAQNTKMLPNQKANSTETRLKINLDSCRNQNSNNSSFNDTKYTNNNYLSLNSNSSNDTSKKSPINEWVNEKLLNDRFKIDRRASDISSLVDKDSFYGDSVDMMGSRIAEEISKITDKFCRINDESDSGNGRGMLLGKPPANVQQIQQDRHDKITDLLNGKRRPKYRRLTYMNRDVPLGSTPPPTNLTYYLTNLNSTNPLWAANFEVPSCNFFSAPGTPIGSPRSPTETSLDHDIIFQMLSDKLKEVESNISAKKANMVNT